MDGLLAWIACVGDAQPFVSYADWLVGAGFCVQAEIARNDCLRKMVKQIRGKLLLADIMIERQFSYQGWISGRRRSLLRPRRTILKHKLGYALLVAQKPAACMTAGAAGSTTPKDVLPVFRWMWFVCAKARQAL